MSLLLKNYLPALRYGAKLYSTDVLGIGTDPFHNTWYVDGDNGDDTSSGTEPGNAIKTISQAVSLSSAGDTILVKSRTVTALATDPVSYTDNVVIPNSKPGIKIIGVSNNITQGGLPQLKVGTTTSSPIIAIKAPGCSIMNIGINGAGATGGGIVLYDDGGTATVSFGTMIDSCHFKNCRGSSATDSRTGGAIVLGSVSGDNAPWQLKISNNTFYKNVGGIVLKGAAAVPQDWLIEGNTFMGTAATVDSYIYTAAGSGVANLTIKGNSFASAIPALSSGSVVRYVDLTGSTGIFSDNYFACTDTTTGFGAAKATAKIPTTVGIAHNYSDGGLIVREA